MYAYKKHTPHSSIPATTKQKKKLLSPFAASSLASEIRNRYQNNKI